MIPLYPLFRPLELTDKLFFDEAFAKNPPVISEYTFTNIYSWRNYYNFHISDLNGFIILRSSCGGVIEFFPPIARGDSSCADTGSPRRRVGEMPCAVNTLVSQEREAIIRVISDTKAVFTRIPEGIKSIFEGDALLDTLHTPGHCDYLYKSGDLINLKGSKYDGKRNFIKRFKSSYNYQYMKIGPGDKKECLDFEEEWCRQRQCDEPSGLLHERRAFECMLENLEKFSLCAGAIKIDNKICALALGETLNPETFVVHILKAFPKITGLYQAMNNEFLSKEAKEFKYVNLEEDMDLEGLRKAKLSYYPCSMVEKYNLALKAR